MVGPHLVYVLVHEMRKKKERYLPRTCGVDLLDHGVPTIADNVDFGGVVQDDLTRVEGCVLVSVEVHVVRVSFEHVVPLVEIQEAIM